MRKGLDAGTDSARIHPKNAWTIMGIACQRGERHDPRPVWRIHGVAEKQSYREDFVAIATNFFNRPCA